MSDMHDPDDEMPDDPFGIPEEAVRAEGDLIMERWQNYEDACRQIGLYIEGHPAIAIVPTPVGPKIALQVTFQMGRVAFSDRVQNPETAKFDDEARKMDVSLTDDKFLDERARIQQALAAGKSLADLMKDDEDDTDDASGV